jgi:folate-binding protein YgfZ
MTIHTALLEDRGVLQVSGEDAVSFLQGLVTNDVEGCAVGEARYAALLSPQGKILFDFLVLRIPAEAGAAFLIDCPIAQAGDLAKRLGFYRLRAKVTIAGASARYAVFARWTQEGSSGELAVPPTPKDGFLYVDPRDPRLGSRLIGHRDQVVANSESAAYEAHRIKLGVPRGGVDFTYADNFPHDANLDLLHGVDFKKGCYVGQEVVSRMHHRSEPRKRIVRLALAGEGPQQGMPVLAGETTVGTLGSTAGSAALALLRLDRVEDARGAGKPLSVGGVAAEVAGY